MSKPNNTLREELESLLVLVDNCGCLHDRLHLGNFCMKESEAKFDKHVKSLFSDLYQQILSEATDYDLVTHDFGTPQVVGQTKAVSTEALKRVFTERGIES